MCKLSTLFRRFFGVWGNSENFWDWPLMDQIDALLASIKQSWAMTSDVNDVFFAIKTKKWMTWYCFTIQKSSKICPSHQNWHQNRFSRFSRAAIARLLLLPPHLHHGKRQRRNRQKCSKSPDAWGFPFFDASGFKTLKRQHQKVGGY